jgi:Protein of Unknown function (DUF2784)
VRGLLLDSVILLHAAWVLFLAAGFVFVVRHPKIALIHVGGLFLSFFLNLMGWYCPLTYLENFLHALEKADVGYTSSFMKEHVYRFLYPDLPELTIRIGEMIFVCVNFLGYAYIARRRGWFRHPLSKIK